VFGEEFEQRVKAASKKAGHESGTVIEGDSLDFSHRV
jgi:hypothetical protein